MSDQNGRTISSHDTTLNDHERRLGRLEEDVGECGERTIKIDADIRANRWLLVTGMSMLGTLITILRFVGG